MNFNARKKLLWSEILKKRDENINIPQLREIKRYKTCLKNAMVIDFRTMKIEKEYAMKFLKIQFPNSKRVKIVHNQRLIELGFATKEELKEACNKELLLDGIAIDSIMLMHESEDFEKIEITNLSTGDDKNETELMIHQTLMAYGAIQRIILREEYGLLLPEATVIIERNGKKIPSELLINDGMAYIDYKNGPKRCLICKKSGHVYGRLFLCRTIFRKYK